LIFLVSCQPSPWTSEPAARHHRWPTWNVTPPTACSERAPLGTRKLSRIARRAPIPRLRHFPIQVLLTVAANYRRQLRLQGSCTFAMPSMLYNASTTWSKCCVDLTPRHRSRTIAYQLGEAGHANGLGC
jgi:hypothetical protein